MAQVNSATEDIVDLLLEILSIINIFQRGKDAFACCTFNKK